MAAMPRTVSRPAKSDSAQLADQMEAVACSGDREAYAAIFRTFSPRIRAYLMRLGAEPAHADELTQETMVTVWRRAQTFDRRQAAVATWLFTIARNKRIDALRRERRPEFDPNDPALAPAPETPPDVQVDQAQRQARVRRDALGGGAHAGAVSTHVLRDRRARPTDVMEHRRPRDL